MTPDSADALRLKACIERYHVEHRHPDRPRPIMHAIHTMQSWEGKPESWAKGCYAIYSADGDILYIGKASNTKTVGDRIVRFRYKRSNWQPPPEFVQIIEVAEAFEAPSLEEFLIREMQPRFNDRGINRRIGPET